MAGCMETTPLRFYHPLSLARSGECILLVCSYTRWLDSMKKDEKPLIQNGTFSQKGGGDTAVIQNITCFSKDSSFAL